MANNCWNYVTFNGNATALKKLRNKFKEYDKTNYFTEFNHPGVLLENKEKSAIIFKAIHQLPEAQKIVFTLHKVDGKSYKEISEIIEKSISSVESLIFRAKINLQKQLEYFYKNKN